MALTAAQQKLIDTAQKEYDSAVNDYNTAVFIVGANQSNWQRCQAARDSKSTSTGKNKACHLDTLASLRSAWENSITARNASESIMLGKKAALDKILKDIETSNLLAAGALAGDPTFNLATQQNVLQASQAAAAQKAKADLAAQAQAEKDKRKKIYTWVIGGLSVIAIGVGIYLLYSYFKAKVTEPVAAATATA